MAICVILTYDMEFFTYVIGGRAWTHTYVFVSGSDKESVFAQSNFISNVQILKIDCSEFVTEEGRQRFCKLQLINLFQFKVQFGFSSSFCVYYGKRVQVAYIWRSQDFRMLKYTYIYIYILTRQKYVNFFLFSLRWKQYLLSKRVFLLFIFVRF